MAAHSVYLTIAVVAAAFDIDPGVSVPGAWLDDLHARGEHLGLHVVDEAGSRLAAIHHPGQAVLAFLANKKLSDIKFC